MPYHDLVSVDVGRSVTTISLLSYRHQDALYPLHPLFCRHDSPHQLEDSVPRAAQGIIGRSVQGFESGPLLSGSPGS